MLRKPNRQVTIASYFVHRYPLETVGIFFGMFFASISEGLGIMSIVLVVQILQGAQSTTHSPVTNLIFEKLQTLGITPTIGPILSLVLGFIIIRTVFLVGTQIYTRFIQTRVEADFRYDLIDLVLRTKWNFFVSVPIGRFANSLNKESGVAASTYEQICKGGSAITNMFIYLTAAMFLSWPLALALVVTAVVMTTCLKVFVGITRRTGVQQANYYKSMVSRFSDGLQGIKTLKAMGLENVLTPLLRSEIKGLMGAQMRMGVAKILLQNIREPVVAIVVTVGMIVALNFWTLQLPILVGMVILFNRGVTSAGQIQAIYQGLVSNEGFYFSLKDLMDQARANQEVMMPTGHYPRIEQGITFERVSFEYENGIPTLKDVSMSIKVGQITALIGVSGSGKTTVADLVCGLILPNSGQIKIGQRSLSECSLVDWRAQIGYVQQDPVLFHDTVFQNVSLGVNTISKEQVEEALGNAGALDFVKKLSNGLDTIIGERGIRLSGGQRQRITIARALVRDPTIIILDEATTGLDPTSESEVLKTLFNLRDRLAIFFISHQPAIRDVADRVYRLNDGMIEMTR